MLVTPRFCTLGLSVSSMAFAAVTYSKHTGQQDMMQRGACRRGLGFLEGAEKTEWGTYGAVDHSRFAWPVFCTVFKRRRT